MIEHFKHSEALDTIPLPKGWKLVPCQTEQFKHVLLRSEGSSETCSIPLTSSGSFRIHLGAYRSPNAYYTFQVKFSSWKYWRRVVTMTCLNDTDEHVQNTDLGVFEIREGDHFMIRTEFDRPTAIAYLHLEETPIPKYTWHKNNVGVVFDMAEILGIPRIDHTDDLKALMEPYRESDFSHIFWGNAAGTYNPLYFSKVLGYQGESDHHLKIKGSFDHRSFSARTMRLFKKANLDPLVLAIEHAHDMGMQLWSNHRINKNHSFDFDERSAGGRFLIQHQDKRVVEPDGTLEPHHTLSFAYPEIRENAIEFLAEQAEMGVDGIFIDFLRFRYIIGWEEIVLTDYKKKYGEDIRSIRAKSKGSEWAISWLEHQASYITQFMRDLRTRIDSIGQNQKRHIPIGVQVQSNWHLGFGCNLSILNGQNPEVWARENLIDFLAPCYEDGLWYNINPFDRIKQQLEGTACKIWGHIGNFARPLQPTLEEKKNRNQYTVRSYIHPERIARLAYDYYNQEADGIYIWEGEETANVFPRWNIIKHLGNRQNLARKFGLALDSYDGWEIRESLKTILT